MGWDFCSESFGFKSQHLILDGHFCTLICCKNCNVCLKKIVNKQKEARVAHLKNLLYRNVSEHFWWLKSLTLTKVMILTWYNDVAAVFCIIESRSTKKRWSNINVKTTSLNLVKWCRESCFTNAQCQYLFGAVAKLGRFLLNLTHTKLGPQNNNVITKLGCL